MLSIYDSNIIVDSCTALGLWTLAHVSTFLYANDLGRGHVDGCYGGFLGVVFLIKRMSHQNMQLREKFPLKTRLRVQRILVTEWFYCKNTYDKIEQEIKFWFHKSLDFLFFILSPKNNLKKEKNGHGQT